MKKTAFLLFIATITCSCVTKLKPGAESVRITYNISAVEGCEYKGEVKAKSQQGGVLFTDISEEDALNKLKNKAYEMGANVVLLSTEKIDRGAAYNPYAFGGVTQTAQFRARGEAYFCDQNKNAKAKQIDKIKKEEIAKEQQIKDNNLNLTPDKPYDFRKANWNMSKMEVEATEPLIPIKKDENSIVYEDNIYGLKCAIIYSFDNDKLLRGTIIITETHNDLNLYINDFNNIKNIMTYKYGKPSEENLVWRNPEFKENIQMWGEAIKLGHLIIYSKWIYDNVLIHLQISSENEKIKLGIQYRKP